MLEMVAEARVVITHGGPSSFIMPLQIGKTPVVVPRQKKHDEHVNNHQVKFCHQAEERMGTIVVVDDIVKLGGVIDSYDKIKKEGKNTCNNARIVVKGLFCFVFTLLFFSIVFSGKNCRLIT